MVFGKTMQQAQMGLFESFVSSFLSRSGGGETETETDVELTQRGTIPTNEFDIGLTQRDTIPTNEFLLVDLDVKYDEDVKDGDVKDEDVKDGDVKDEDVNDEDYVLVDWACNVLKNPVRSPVVEVKCTPVFID